MLSLRLRFHIGRATSHDWRILVAGAALLLLSPPGGLIEVSAGTSYYGAYPIAGSGSFTSYPENQRSYFTFNDGSVDIDYDPDVEGASSMTVSSGSAGYSVYGYLDFTVSVAGDAVTFSATGNNGAYAFVVVLGDPGPLNSEGIPESLDDLDGDAVAFVEGTGGFHDEFSFTGITGQSVPEPSSLTMLPIGIGFVLACVIRGKKTRQG